MSALIMIVSAGAIVLLVKFGLLRGIDQIANALNWSATSRGQVTGYATSVPELVCLVSAGLAGVWEAGLWNIASSNIINVILMSLAVTRYRQVRELFKLRFVDEVGFVTSIPEVVSFFAVFAASRSEGRLDELNDTQEVLDNLASSNMSNVGVVYPIGLLAYLLVSTLFSV